MLEEIGEEPYRIDRMFAQLKHSGILNSASGIILGNFTDCKQKSESPSLSLDRIFRDYLMNLKIPIIKNFAHGHNSKKLTVPFGINCKIDEGIILTERAVVY